DPPPLLDIRLEDNARDQEKKEQYKEEIYVEDYDQKLVVLNREKSRKIRETRFEEDKRPKTDQDTDYE
ncbi:hypothetical protein SMA90_32405, partial [Escherichia coli]